jgi:hypothetical protein
MWQLQVLARLGELVAGIGIGATILYYFQKRYEAMREAQAIRVQVRQAHLRVLRRPYDWEIDG